MDSDIGKIQKLIKSYRKYITMDNLIITHNTDIETLSEDKASNDILANIINNEIKKLEKKYNYFPLPYITDKLMGEKRVIKNDNKVKVKHILPIKSIDKMEIGDKLSNHFDNIEKLIIMPKYDGVSCICWNERDQDSVIFATKSNDSEGENITTICSKIVDVSKIKSFFNDHQEILGIRGELILTNSYTPNTTRLAELNGLLRSKKPDVTMFPYLRLIFYFVYIDPNATSALNLVDYLTKLKSYKVEITKIFNKPSELDIISENVITSIMSTMDVPFDCDGIIFRDYSLNFDISLAVKKAYYFEAKVKEIEFVFGEKTGVYVPKIYIEYSDKTINKTITKVHGYNLNYLFLHKIQINSIIEIKYSGDTIAVISNLISKGFSKTSTFEKYVKYIQEVSKGLDNAIFYDDEFIGKIDHLYNFIKKQNIVGGGTAKIKEYLNAVYADRISEVNKVKIYTTYIDILKANKYVAIHGMPLETIQTFSKYIITLLKNRKKTLELAIDAVAIPLLTYSAFNRAASLLDIIMQNDVLIDITPKYKSTQNITSRLILENKADIIIIYNLFFNF